MVLLSSLVFAHAHCTLHTIEIRLALKLTVNLKGLSCLQCLPTIFTLEFNVCTYTQRNTKNILNALRWWLPSQTRFSFWIQRGAIQISVIDPIGNWCIVLLLFFQHFILWMVNGQWSYIVLWSLKANALCTQTIAWIKLSDYCNKLIESNKTNWAN